MAVLLGAAMMATPFMSAVPVYAQDTELMELAGSSAEDGLTVLGEESDAAVYESDECLTDNFGSDAVADEAETGEDTVAEGDDASFDSTAKGAGISADALKV